LYADFTATALFFFLTEMVSHVSSDSFLYRRQFILGNCPVPDLPEWKSIPFGPFHLKVHPDLEIILARGSKAEFLLLGFVLNHHRPEASNQELMDEMAGTCHNLEKMLEYCRDLCGRYVIVFNFAGKTGLLNDLIGSRSVYYCIHQNTVWCASQPSTLARLLRIDEDPSAGVRAYVERDMFTSGEGCWIGDGTKYIGVKHLLPNHYLDFDEKRSVRYWPTCPLDTLDIESATRKSAAMLENTMRAASNRFQLSMAVTAGWDSRCLLAATTNVRSEIYYYIQKYGGMTDSHPDIKIPRKLARKLGFTFHIIECDDYQDDAFDVALERNVFALHNPAKKVLYRSFYQNFKGKVNASGNISDLCRTIYGINPVHEITNLLALVHLSDSEYAAASLNDWYAEAKPRCDALGYNLRDLFFWEQKLGNWGSMFAAELDIAIDEFYPFGTRRLVETILAIDEKLRPYDNSSVHQKMIELLWPELLSAPINPIGWRARAARLLRKEGKRTLGRLGLLPHIETLLSTMRGR
jgi:hypothetical protein